jgi:hypothetical protein
MATTYKVLGQSIPNANTSTDLYTVPSATQTVVSSIVMCNQAASTGKFRVAVRPSGESLANKHYISYDTEIPANDTITLTLGLSLAATDVVTVYSYSTSSISYNLFGAELT